MRGLLPFFPSSNHSLWVEALFCLAATKVASAGWRLPPLDTATMGSGLIRYWFWGGQRSNNRTLQQPMFKHTIDPYSQMLPSSFKLFSVNISIILYMIDLRIMIMNDNTISYDYTSPFTNQNYLQTSCCLTYLTMWPYLWYGSSRLMLNHYRSSQESLFWIWWITKCRSETSKWKHSSWSETTTLW